MEMGPLQWYLCECILPPAPSGPLHQCNLKEVSHTVTEMPGHIVI